MVDMDTLRAQKKSRTTRQKDKYNFSAISDFTTKGKMKFYKSTRKKFSHRLRANAKKIARFSVWYKPAHRSYSTKISERYSIKTRLNNPLVILATLFRREPIKEISNKGLKKFLPKEKMIKGIFSKKYSHKLPRMRYDSKESEIWY